MQYRAKLTVVRGPIRTPLLMDFLDTPEKLNRRLIHCPMGRFGEAVEQAKAVVFRRCSQATSDCVVDSTQWPRRTQATSPARISSLTVAFTPVTL